MYDCLSDPAIRQEIRSQFPAPTIHRRNTGYAIDTLLDCQPFHEQGDLFNFSSLLTGSEGTLAITTEIKIHVDPLPPSHIGLLCIHFESLQASLAATVIAMRHNPRAVELMDRIVMDCTKTNLFYQKIAFLYKEILRLYWL